MTCVLCQEAPSTTAWCRYDLMPCERSPEVIRGLAALTSTPAVPHIKVRGKSKRLFPLSPRGATKTPSTLALLAKK